MALYGHPELMEIPPAVRRRRCALVPARPSMSKTREPRVLRTVATSTNLRLHDERLLRTAKPIPGLRNLTRYRKAQLEERTREAQRLDKGLQDAGIKLSSVASDVLGVSARAMLRALVAGTRDPELLAELARGTLRKKIPALREALHGRFGPHHALLVGTILAKLEFLDEALAQLS